MRCFLMETSWSTHEYSLASLQRTASDISRVAYHQPYSTHTSPGLLHERVGGGKLLFARRPRLPLIASIWSLIISFC